MALEHVTAEQKRAIDKARKRVIETIGKNMDLYGVNATTGHLYGQMFFENEPVTLDGLVQSMGMSKTSMSTGVRTLVDLNMIHKVWEKGSRKDYFEVEPDWFQTFTDFFVLRWRKSMEMNLQALRKSIAELKGLAADNPVDEQLQTVLRIDLEKMESASRYYLWLGRLIDKFESGDIYDFVPKGP